MMKHLLYILFIAVLNISITSCCCHKKAASTSDVTTKKEESIDYEKQGFVKATVIILNLDGCNYLLQLGSGKRLEVQGLPVELKKEKLQLWIKYVPDKEAMSICMAGEIVKLTEYKIIK